MQKQLSWLIRNAVGLLVVLVFVLAGCSALVGKADANEINTAYLTVVEEYDNVHYLKKASPGIIFHITVPDSSSVALWELKDASGSIVNSVHIDTDQGFDISPPEGGYIPGERYTLDLIENAVFSDQNLRDVRTLVFLIERESAEEYTFTSQVKEQKVGIQKVNNDRISMDDISANQGDIVFGQDPEGDYVAYRIEEILEDGTATVSLPALDEIYEDLNVYGEYEFDVENFVPNPDLEAEIIASVRNSSFFDFLIATAYAEENPIHPEIKVEFDPNPDDNKMKVTVEMKLSPNGEDMFGIDGFDDHEVTITHEYTVGVLSHVDIASVSAWDIAVTTTSSFVSSIDISRCVTDTEELTKLFANNTSTDGTGGGDKDAADATNSNDDLSETQKENYLKRIVEKLKDGNVDDATFEIDLFEWPTLHIPNIPGLGIRANFGMYLECSILLNGMYGTETTCTPTTGVMLCNGEFISYSDKNYGDEQLTISMSGRAEGAIGAKLTIMTEFVDEDIANIKIKPKVGVRLRAFLAAALTVDDGEITGGTGGYLEFGPYAEASISAYVNLLFSDLTFEMEIYESEWEPWFTAGSKKIPLGIGTQKKNAIAFENSALAPTFYYEYFDIVKNEFNEVAIDFSELEFAMPDGTILRKGQNGYIHLPEGYHHNESIPITVKYICDNAKVFTTVFWLYTLDVYTSYEDLLERGVTDSGLEINYYKYLDLNKDGIPELIVADQDGTPNSWTIAEVYTYVEPEIKLCGETNSRWDYFYYVNDEYFLGRQRMGNVYVSVLGYMDRPVGDGRNYNAMPDSGIHASDRFVQTAVPIELQHNYYGDITENEAVQLLCEAEDFFIRDIFGRQFVDATIYSPEDFSWIDGIIEYNDSLYEPNDKYTYDEFVQKLKYYFTEDTVAEIVEIVGLIEYNGVCYTYIRERVGDIYLSEYSATVTATEDGIFNLQASFVGMDLEDVTIHINCLREDRHWKINGFDFYGYNDEWYPTLP